MNLDRIKGYNSVNYKLGYPMLEIGSPKDLVNYGDYNLNLVLHLCM